MFGKIGTGELLVVLLVALIIFGPSKLPALGKMAGKAIGTLRHYADSSNWDELLEEEEEEEPAARSKAGKSTPREAAEEAPQEEPETEDSADPEAEREEERAS